MEFTATNNSAVSVSLKEAVLTNLPDGGGLYMPKKIPVVQKGLLEGLQTMSFDTVSYEVLKVLLQGALPDEVLARICRTAFTFPVPLVRLDERVATLELFHGPTLAFKDVGVRFMAELLSYYRKGGDKPITILTATSGDTGGAVASAFHNRKGFSVVILYPNGKVSELQELQIASLGDNITAIAVEGNFDDCQRLAKQALADAEIRSKLSFGSANSINVARLLPQVCYYFHAAAQLGPGKSEVVFSVPSGNFGNLCAGLVAKRMGLPVKLFIAASNENDVVPRYLNTGHYEVRPFRETLSTAMDIADPNNFARILHLFGNSFETLKKEITGISVSDAETVQGMKELFNSYGYTSEPHGAVAYLGLKSAMGMNANSRGLFLGTAHPVKFKKLVERIIPNSVPLPDKVSEIFQKRKKAIALPVDFHMLKQTLIKLP